MATLASVNGRGVVASRPAASTPGALYFATDVGPNGTLQRDNGSTWDNVEGVPALTTVSTVLGADVTMTSATTWYDGPTVSLPAGTWLLIASLTVTPGASAGYLAARLWDGTTSVSSAETYVQAGGVVTTFPLMAIVTPGSTTTYRAAANFASTGAKISAALPSAGVGNNASGIFAVKIG